MKIRNNKLWAQKNIILKLNHKNVIERKAKKAGLCFNELQNVKLRNNKK